MVEVTTIANQLNKDHNYVIELCKQKNIEIQYDSQGMWIYDCDAEQLLQQEIEKPTRYNFRGIECTELQRYLMGDKAMQTFWLGNCIKYLYRRRSVGDLKKAAAYLQMWIDEVEKKGVDVE